MKNIAFAAFLTLIPVSVFAADLPVKAPVYQSAPAFSWTGFYLGGQGGWGKGDSDVRGVGFIFDFDHEGSFGGIFGGYNYQFAPNWVIGAELDWNWASIDGRQVPQAGLHDDSELNSFGSVRVRLGYSRDRWMLFATGGWSGADAAIGSTAFANSFLQDKTLSGWTAGGGIEYAFSQNWFGRVEYRHYDWGRESVSHVLPFANRTFKTDLDTISVGLSYRM